MNGFQLHNITHTSASSINLWKRSPQTWVQEKLFGVKSYIGPAAYRGIAIEKALVAALSGAEVDSSIAEATAEFNSKLMFAGGDVDKERNAIAPCVKQGVIALREYGTPTFEASGGQNKINTLCRGDGYDLPVIGYLDLVYPEHALVVDIKTTFNVPDSMSADHRRQSSIYKNACSPFNFSVKFLYLTPDASLWLEHLDIDETLREIKSILNDQEVVLRTHTKEQLKDYRRSSVTDKPKAESIALKAY